MKIYQCDFCENDLTYSDGISQYRLNLNCIHCPHIGGVIDVMIYPTLSEEKNFCGLGCLKKWLEKDCHK